MQDLTRWVFAGLKNLVLNGLLLYTMTVVYGSSGIMLAVGYNFLAGGNLNTFILTIVPTIVTMLSLVILWSLLPSNSRNEIVSVLMILFCLPIFLNALSLILSSRGFKAMADYAFLIRYWSLLLIPPLGGLILILMVVVRKLFKYLRRIVSSRVVPAS